MTAFTPEGQDLRALLSRLIATVPELSRELAERLSGLAVAYERPPGVHPLTGRRAPNLRLPDGELFTLLHPGRHVLLDLTTTPHEGWPAAALIRPDGHVAWAGDDPSKASRS
ncbi:hypothetical protein GCM10010191_59880 [Actinomadura vinacea]|uniref:Uncharacterized protein n=2 Tax=Actinomadura vinacea TaxID=115336 RepID=A0ABN3JSS9_9ACTN